MTTISYAEPATHFEMPDDRQAAALLAIAEGAHPEWTIKVELGEFKLAMFAIGGMWRLDAPSQQYSFAHFLDAANERLQAKRLGQINGPAFLRAVVAMNDIAWRAQDKSVGEVLAFALDQYSGRPCSNAWRRLLAGDAPRSALPARQFLQQSTERGPVRIYRRTG